MRFDKAAIYIRANVAQRVGQKGRGPDLGGSLRLLGLVYENNGRFSDMAGWKKYDSICKAQLLHCEELGGT